MSDLRFGLICDLDPTKGMARVYFEEDDKTSSWIPISVPFSKENKAYLPLSINEHIWCMMDENCEFGVIGGAIYSDTDAPPTGSSNDVLSIHLAANTTIEYDRNEQTLNLNLGGDLVVKTVRNVGIESDIEIDITAPLIKLNGNVVTSGTLTAAAIATTGGGAIQSTGDVEVNGNMTINGDAIIGGKSFNSHKHQAGSTTTTPPL